MSAARKRLLTSRMIPACGKRGMPTAEVTRLGSKRMTVRIDAPPLTTHEAPRSRTPGWSAWMARPRRVTRVHHIDGALSAEELDRLCREVLIDPVVDEAVIDGVTPAQGEWSRSH